jgi:tetratricopeptide (TPR) repeat protein
MRTLATLTLIAAAFTLSSAPARAASKIDETEQKANGLLDKGKVEDAIKAIDKLQKDASPEAQVAASRIFNRAGKVDDALHAAQSAQQSAAAAPADLRARVLAQLAAVELRNASSLDALAHAEAAAKLAQSPEILTTLVLARARTKDPQALATADELVKSAPKSAAAQDARGEALAAARRYDEADAAFTRAIQLDPKLYLPHVHQAMALLDAGRAVDAERLAAAATTTIDPGQPEGWAVLAAARITKDPKNWKAASEPAQQAVFLAPSSAYALYWRGKILDSTGNPAEATAVYQAAAKADPGFGKARLAVLSRITNDEAAIAEASKLAQELPHDAEVQWLAGEVLVKKHDYAGALEPLERAVALDPKNGKAAASLGEAYRGNHEYGRAAEKFRQALDIIPDDLEYQRLYGITLAASRQCRAAAPIVEKLARRKQADAGNLYFWLGWCQFQVARDAKSKNGVLDALDTAKKAKPLMAAEDKRALRLINVINDWLSNTRRFQGTPPPPPVEEACDLSHLVETANAGAEETRVRSIRTMVCAGDEAVKYLISYLADGSAVVRRAAAKALSSVGASARTACPQLDRQIEASQNNTLPSDDDKKRTPQEQLQRLTREREFQEAAQATVTKICKK